ncbi:MAG: methionine--tRNA ligase [Candidatus Micrarchaeia archaeon]
MQVSWLSNQFGCKNKVWCIKMSEKFYITTAIPYINAPPHMGHALEFVLVDTIARYQKLKGKDVFLTTGTDENSLKTVQAANKAGVAPQVLSDKYSSSFREFADKIGLNYDAFIRTSDKDAHWDGVVKLWDLCYKSGDIYKKSYEGLYCVGCEAFYTKDELVNGLCPEHLTKPEIISEENYFFKLSKYEQEIKNLIKTDKLKIIPESRKNEILSFLDQGLDDLSISRSNKRAKGWGIPVPNDDSQMIYVWFDALSVYLTGVGFGRDEKKFKKLWPADMHVIGKGIFRFHAIYWPAILLSAGLELPKEILVHGYITSNGQKMSKSIGNIIDPIQILDKYGRNNVRFYLLHNISVFEDGDFSEADLIKTTNSELVGNIGNFIHRTLTFIYKNFDGKVEAKDLDKSGKELLEKIDKMVDEIDKELSELRIGSGLAKILAISAMGNKYFQDSKPWELVVTNKNKCEGVLFVCANICRTLSVLLEPFLPEASEKLSKYLNIEIKLFSDAKPLTDGVIKTNEPKALFQKIN